MTAGIAAAAYAGDPGDAARHGQRGRVRHRPRGPAQARDPASTGRRSRRSRGRSSSTWACARCRASPSELDRGRAAARTSPSRSSSAARCPTSASSPGRSPTSPSARRRRGSGRRRSRSSAPVAGLRDELAWLERRPLAGRRIVVTRARAAGQRARGALRDARRDRRRGARHPRSSRSTSSCPTSTGYDLVCLTSPNGVDRLLRARARRAGARRADDRRHRARAPPTAARARRRGRRRPRRRAVAEALVEALAGLDVARALIVLRAREGRDVLPDALRERGARSTS